MSKNIDEITLKVIENLISKSPIECSNELIKNIS